MLPGGDGSGRFRTAGVNRLRWLVAPFLESFEAWNEHEAPRRAAAMAYSALFALTPLLLLAIAVLGLVFGSEAMVAIRVVTDLMPPGLAGDLTGLAEGWIDASGFVESSLLAAAIGFGILLFACVGLTREYRSTIRIMWGLPLSRGGVTGFAIETALSFGLLALGGVLLVTAVGVTVVLEALGTSLLSGIPLLSGVLDLAIAVGATGVVFTAGLKFVAGRHFGWRHVAAGGGLTALLFVLGNKLLAIYLSRVSIGSVYGAAGSVVVGVFWVYWCAWIVLYGAEFVRAVGGRPRPRTLLAASGETVVQPAGVRPSEPTPTA